MPTAAKQKQSYRRRLDTFLRDFGPAKAITYEEGFKLFKQGQGARVLTLVESGSTATMLGAPGYHYVNRLGMYELAKPVPENITEVYDVYFGDTALPEVI